MGNQFIGVNSRTTSLNLGGIQLLALRHFSDYNRLFKWCVKSKSKAHIPDDAYDDAVL